MTAARLLLGGIAAGGRRVAGPDDLPARRRRRTSPAWPVGDVGLAGLAVVVIAPPWSR